MADCERGKPGPGRHVILSWLTVVLSALCMCVVLVTPAASQPVCVPNPVSCLAVNCMNVTECPAAALRLQAQIAKLPGQTAQMFSDIQEELIKFAQDFRDTMSKSAAQSTATQKAATQARARMTDFEIQQDRESAQLIRESKIVVEHRPSVEQCIAMGAHRNRQLLADITQAQIRLTSENFTKEVIQNSKLAGADASNTVQILNIAKEFVDQKYHNEGQIKLVQDDALAVRDPRYLNADIDFQQFFLNSLMIEEEGEKKAADAMLTYLAYPEYNEPKIEDRQKMQEFRQAEFFRAVSHAAFNREHAVRMVPENGPKSGVWLREWMRSLGVSDRDVGQIPDEISQHFLDAAMNEWVLQSTNFLAKLSGDKKQSQMLQVMNIQTKWDRLKTLRLLAMVESTQLYILNDNFRKDRASGTSIRAN